MIDNHLNYKNKKIKLIEVFIAFIKAKISTYIPLLIISKSENFKTLIIRIVLQLC